MDFAVKDVPPVPLKTYQWEDLKRDKERGKYPYTYLYKNLLVEQENMPEDEKKPLVCAERENPADEEQKKLEAGEQKRRKEDIHATKAETEHSEHKEEKTLSYENERIAMRQDSTDDIEIKYELLVEEEVSHVEFIHDSKSDVTQSVSETPITLEVPQDHKRKHSGSCEGTKSNLSLFERITNSKFKPPTFQIPQFKQLTFLKRGPKRVKHNSKEQKVTVTAAEKSEVTLQTRTCESPVYIYIPLNPTAEDLEKERQQASKSESHRRLADTANSRTDQLNDRKDTNGTVSSATASRNVDVQSTSSNWKGLQSKTDKKSPPFKKKTKGTNAKEALPKLEKKTSPVSKKSDDSPVEYIYIPLKPPENETWDEPSSDIQKSFDEVEAVNTKLISTHIEVSVVTKNDETRVDKPVVKEEEEIITEARQLSETKEPQKPELEIKQLPNVINKPDEHKFKGAIKKKSDDKVENINEKTTKLTKDIKKLVSKLKGEQPKTKRESSSLKTASSQAPAEKKNSPTSKNYSDSPVEYIYIPLKGPLPDENPAVVEQVEVKRSEAENTSTKAKIQGVTVAIIEKEKLSLNSKFKGLNTESAPAIKKDIEQFTGKKGSPKSSRNESFNKKSSPPLPSVKRSDSPVEYIYIPLKPLQSEVSEELLKCTDDKAGCTLMELQTFKEDTKFEKPKETLIKQVDGKGIKLEKVPDKPKETQKDNIMTKLRGIKPKKAKAPKPDVKAYKEHVTEKIKSPPMDLKSSDAPVEYIYIPLKPPASERAEIVAQSSSLSLEERKRRKIEDNTEEARLIKEAVIKMWQGFKTKPLQKPMPLKRTEPKMTSPKTGKKSTSVVGGRGDSSVEYIYIPLNPSAEQLEYERKMKEEKRLAKASSAARTSECSAVAAGKSKKAAVKTGAIKKQPTENGNKIKDTTTKLTEDIKEFASKLKDIQGKSKKPTFKTFKHGSKSGSKRMSPTTPKKPIDTRSPPVPRQHEDLPVEYIFIPLKDPETTEEPMKETGKDIREAAAISIPSEVVEKIEEAVEKPSTLEKPYYELLTKEDEEDGLKTAIIASLNEMKPSDEVLKAEDSPKLNWKLSIESIKMKKMEIGLDQSQNGDENAVYEETIQTKDEQPDTSVSTARKLVTVPSMAVDEQMIKDTSLEDDHNKWSKSTLLAVC